MAEFRYFSDFSRGSVELFGQVDIRSNAFAAAVFPGVKAKRYDSFDRMFMADDAGVILPVSRSIERKSRPSMHKCDKRCINAKGFRCECECGGKNHGRGSFACEAA